MKRPISVTPVETGVQRIYDDLKRLDSGFRRNDEEPHFRIFYETIKNTEREIKIYRYGNKKEMQLWVKLKRG